MNNFIRSSCVTAMVWFFLLQVLLLATGVKGEIPALIVFGDSSVDSGNNNYIPTISKSDFPPYGRDFPGGRPTGRFCNGLLPTDLISSALGLKPVIPAYLDPHYSIEDFATGVCFASAGTGLDASTSATTYSIPIWEELAFYKHFQERLRLHLGEDRARNIIQESLYVISIGTNDFLISYFGVKELHELGGRKISVAGLIPMGCLPIERDKNLFHGRSCNEYYNGVAMDYNEKLQNMVHQLNFDYADLHLVYSNVYETYAQAIMQPESYGFESVSIGCCASGFYETGVFCNHWSPGTCQDANKYMFWDSVHPTERMNQIVVEHLMPTVLLEFMT